MKAMSCYALLTFLFGAANAFGGEVLIIGHVDLPKLGIATVQKIYTGRVVEVNGVAVRPVNAPAGSRLRSKFLNEILNQDDEQYIAYWTVRRYIGKGLPPDVLPSSSAVIDYISSIPGAIGYIEESDFRPGMNVLFRK